MVEAVVGSILHWYRRSHWCCGLAALAMFKPEAAAKRNRKQQPNFPSPSAIDIVRQLQSQPEPAVSITVTMRRG
ncbi:hypothetical protein EMPG_17334 [Blastomyces silverae]|uniref:Uncharacterized protein n=1 Tax=Blastomyces silverae TaxID=2060906 RepID=A0A0H1BD56_9EURO|nr:hypothetical protein EMPG_17334 [Blastomyces silverae]